MFAPSSKLRPFVVKEALPSRRRLDTRHSLRRELELLVQAGLTPAEDLAALERVRAVVQGGRHVPLGP